MMVRMGGVLTSMLATGLTSLKVEKNLIIEYSSFVITDVRERPERTVLDTGRWMHYEMYDVWVGV